MCLEASDTRGSRDNSESPKETDDRSQDNMDTGDLRFYTLAGGNIIELPPIFSHDSENILLVWKDTVRVFQVTTGAWLRDLERSEQKLVAIEFDPNNSKLLYGCPENGHVIVWKWRSGVKEKRIQLQFSTRAKVCSFQLVPNDDMDANGHAPHALVTYLDIELQTVKTATFDLESGKPSDEFDIPLTKLHRVAISKFNFFATIHKSQLHIGFLRNNTWTMHKNPRKRPFTRVVCHPSEPLLATGDEDGQIRLWRNMYSQQVISTLYHWHATPVQTIAFSEFGTHFYSGAKEFVLVKWTIDRPEEKKFLPRLRGAPRQIALGPKNNCVAVALSDNQIQLLDSNCELSAVVQTFTYVHDDETDLEPFPCGLRLHPRTQCLVLNGRVGQLQFYSTQTQSLLYNLDITKENALAAEQDKVIFNTRVTKVAVSEDWMATSECWSDEKRSVHIRMKFWRFDAQKQNYVLNTNILMPHEKDLTGLELSAGHSAESVYCASSGGDHVLKLWTNTREVYGKGNVWSCVGQRSYKDLPIGGLCFSKDGSVLVVGFGRHVVIFKGNNLRDIRCVLTAPTGLDGTISRIGVVLEEGGQGNVTPNKENMKMNGEDGEMTATQANELAGKYLRMDDAEEKKELRRKIFGSLAPSAATVVKPLPELSENKQQMVFEKICDSLDLDLEQKVKTLNGLGIEWGVGDNYKSQRDQLYDRFQVQNERLEVAAQVLESNRPLRTLRDGFERMSIAKALKDADLTNKPRLLPSAEPIVLPTSLKRTRTTLAKQCTEVKCIIQGVGEFSHLLIVTTRNRVLIWNLITLKIQTCLKLSCQHISIDPLSGLVAAFTTNNQLFVFPPNCPIPVYGRKNMPSTYGAIWVPRKVQRSNYSDWQANSQLVFLTKQQELLCFVSDADEEALGGSMNHFLQSYQSQTPFGSMLARQRQVGQQTKAMNGTGGALLLKKSTAKELMNLLPHAMAPLHILCKGYLDSALNKAVGDKLRQEVPSKMWTSSNRMDVDSDSEVEISLDNDDDVISTTRAKLNGSSSETRNHNDSRLESKLKKIAQVNVSV